MAVSPRFKIIDLHGDYQASCKSLKAAIYLLLGMYSGGKIRDANWNRIIVKDTGTDALSTLNRALDKHDKWCEEHEVRFPAPTTPNNTGR